VLLVLLLAILAWPAAGGAAQRTADGAASLELIEGYGPPDATVTIPVDLRTAPDVRVGTIDMAIRLPEALVTFERAFLSSRSEDAGVTLAVTSEPDGRGSTRVRCVLSAGAGGGAPPIPTGQVLLLVFHIAASAAPDTTVPLAPEVAMSTADSPPVRLEPIDVPASRILVMAPVTTSCFFYMH
jgi:hypothetical protein